MGKWAETHWTVERYGDGDSLVIHSDPDHRVCFMAMPGKLGSQDEIEANANLIVAAPNLYEELESACQSCPYCGGTNEDHYNQMNDPGPCPHCASWRAALARANGESQ